MDSPFAYLEGRKLCVVFVQVVDPGTERVRLQCFRGRASIERGRVNVVSPEGAVFTIPGSAQHGILPNDGSAILQDAEYFCLVKADENIKLATKGSE